MHKTCAIQDIQKTCMHVIACADVCSLCLSPDLVCAFDRVLEMTLNDGRYTMLAWVTGALPFLHSLLNECRTGRRIQNFPERGISEPSASAGVWPCSGGVLHQGELKEATYVTAAVRCGKTSRSIGSAVEANICQHMLAGWLNVVGQFACTSGSGYLTAKHMAVMWQMGNGHVLTPFELFLSYASMYFPLPVPSACQSKENEMTA